LDHEGGAIIRRGIRRLIGPVGPDLERLFQELEEAALLLEGALSDLAMDAGTPPGFGGGDLEAGPGLPRLRPILVMLAARAAGEENPEAAEVASAAELLHLAVKIHDAALGRQGGRRRRVARRLLGGAASWLGGNHLTLRALELARAAPEQQVLGDLLDAMREIAEGHALAAALRDRDPSVRDYREYAEGHAGAIFAFCTRAGALLAGAPRPVVMALGRYGRHVGVALHALEDQWSLEASPEELTGLLARCAAAGRPVLPLIRAMEVDPQLDAVLDLLLSEGHPEVAEDLARRVRAAGGLRAARKMVLEESLAARRALRSLPETPHRDLLDRIAAGLARPAGPIEAPAAK
jgi:octaprenyl-diphosphate synthase